MVFHVRAKPYNTIGALEGAQTICQLLIDKRSFSVFLSALGFTETHAYRGVLEDTQEGLPSREPFLVQNRIYMQYNLIILKSIENLSNKSGKFSIDFLLHSKERNAL